MIRNGTWWIALFESFKCQQFRCRNSSALSDSYGEYNHGSDEFHKNLNFLTYKAEMRNWKDNTSRWREILQDRLDADYKNTSKRGSMEKTQSSLKHRKGMWSILTIYQDSPKTRYVVGILLPSDKWTDFVVVSFILCKMTIKNCVQIQTLFYIVPMPQNKIWPENPSYSW